MKKKILLFTGILALLLCGCSGDKNDANYPPYFEPIVQKLEAAWTGGNTDWSPVTELKEIQCDTGLDNGGSEEDGIFTCYIRADDAYYTFDLSFLLTDAGAEEWQWDSAGVFRNEETGKTYVCYHDFNYMNLAGERDPELILVEFETENPADYQASSYAVEPRGSFSWYCDCYRMGDKLYLASDGKLGVIDLNSKAVSDLQEEYAAVEAYAREIIEAHYHSGGMSLCRAILEQDGITVYAAEIVEANDTPAMGLIFVAFQDAKPIAYMNVDLMAETLQEGLEIKMAE